MSDSFFSFALSTATTTQLSVNKAECLIADIFNAGAETLKTRQRFHALR
jgi:hypothetical protein